MGIRITYPNEGLYEGGKPRFEQFDDKTDQITFARYATPEEAMLYAHTSALERLGDQLQRLEQQIHDVQVYGLRHQ